MKVGFIDYFLDEWHANQLFGWLKEASGGEVYPAYAYGMVDGFEVPGFENRMSNQAWAKSKGVELLDTIEEVIEKSDVLMVLAPNHPETHEKLADAALKSGKITYVDKTFAPDVASAKRMIEKAEKYQTPMFTSSALRFAKEFKELNRDEIQMIGVRGSGVYHVYCIHQIEIAVSLLGTGAKRIMAVGGTEKPGIIIEYEDGRCAILQQCGQGCDYDLAINYKDGENTTFIPNCTEYFTGFAKCLVEFFRTGEPPVPYEETLEVISIRERSFEALENPGTWIDMKNED